MNRSRACGGFGTSMYNRPDAVILYVMRLNNYEARNRYLYIRLLTNCD